MTKIERLLFILNIFRVRKSIKINDLITECNVSRRTIYRDLRELISMDIPIYNNDGYNLADDISLPPLNFSRMEQELLGYCLKYTPLRRSERCDKLLNNIELKIISVIPHMNEDSLCRLLIDSERQRTVFPASIDDILENCLLALINNNKLSVDLKVGNGRLVNLTPESLQVGERRWRLIALDESKSKEVAVKIEDIAALELKKGR